VLALLFRGLSWLPLRAVHALGAALGWLIYLLSARYRSDLRANLAQAGLDQAPIRRATIAAAGQQALEGPWLWRRSTQRMAQLIVEEPPGSFDAWLRDPAPLLLLTPHLGGFEAVAQYYATLPRARERPMTALYRVPHKASLRTVIESRARPGLQLAPADMRGVRMLMRALRIGQTAGILPDQVPSAGDGVWVPFFGKPAYTMTLPARLAVATAARVAFVLCERLPRGRGYRLQIVPFEGRLCGHAKADAAALNEALEELIRRCPSQYLWCYRRYKAPAGAAGPECAA
jgi:KDO2-lipid IV(A) lauroyltransferase